METDWLYDWAARAAAELVNLEFSPGTHKAIQFQRVLALQLATLRLATAEHRERLLRESPN